MDLPLVSSELFRPVSKIIADMGTPSVVDRAWRSIGLSADVLKGRPVFLPHQNQAAFIEHAARQLGERHLGAIVGEHLNYPDLGAYATYVLGAPTLATALWRGTSALPFILTQSRVSLSDNKTHLVLRVGTGIQSVVGGRQIDEGMIFVLIDLVRRFVGMDWNPDWVELGARPPGDISRLEERFKAPILFDKELPGIAVAKTLLLSPNPRPGGKSRMLVRDDVRRMSGIGPPTTFTELVRQTMAAHLVSGGFSAETIAKRIGLGVRTLQRRLESEGNSYRDIRSLVLCERARALLSETRMSVADIATALGFEEVNSFRRAFHGWTGMTPPEFIRRQNPLIS